MNIEEENALLDAYRDAIEAEKRKLDGIGADELRQIIAEQKWIIRELHKMLDEERNTYFDTISCILSFSKSIANRSSDIKKTHEIIAILKEMRQQTVK